MYDNLSVRHRMVRGRGPVVYYLRYPSGALNEIDVRWLFYGKANTGRFVKSDSGRPVCTGALFASVLEALMPPVSPSIDPLKFSILGS